MTSALTPQSRCQAAVGRCDITPPVGIYHRMWGAATHERATGIHQPLTASLLWLAAESGDPNSVLVVVSLDHCILDVPDIALFQQAVAAAGEIQPQQVLITLTHTHGAGLMTRSRVDLPGGELIAPYLDSVAAHLGKLAAAARVQVKPATIVYGVGRCTLAAHRDFHDEERNLFACGFNPAGPADDTLVVAKIVSESGTLLASLVNYACHPTTLAWQNTLISPDYVGALRDTIEQQTHAPCLFLQGASGDLGPREGYVGDCAVADRNGRQLAFAALSALESLSPPGTQFVYAGPVISGATLGTWRHEPLATGARRQHSTWNIETFDLPLTYRPELPTRAQTTAELAHWQAVEQQASAAGQADEARDAHAQAERMTRQLWRLAALPEGRFPLRITLARCGDAWWVFVPGEHYQILQTALRQRFSQRPIIVATLTGGWQPGYIPAADTYGRGIYQSDIAVVEQGSAERVIEEIARRLEGS